MSLVADGVASTPEGPQAIAADPLGGRLFLRSHADTSGREVRVSELVLEDGEWRVRRRIETSLKNSDRSGLILDPLGDHLVLVDERGSPESNSDIVLVDLEAAAITEIHGLDWPVNPHSNGTGQVQFAVDLENPWRLFSWDSTEALVFRLDRDTGNRTPLLRLDSATERGRHIGTFLNDIVFDPTTRTVLLADNSSRSILQIDSTAEPALPGRALTDLPGPTNAIALDPRTGEIYLAVWSRCVFVVSRDTGSLTLVARGFPEISDLTVAPSTSGDGVAVFVSDKRLDSVFEITRSGDPAVFERGNSDGVDGLEVTDPIVLLRYLFLGEPEPACLDAADSDDSGALDITDCVLTLDFLFRGLAPPAAPGPFSCGDDPTPDCLDCAFHEDCP